MPTPRAPSNIPLTVLSIVTGGTNQIWRCPSFFDPEVQPRRDGAFSAIIPAHSSRVAARFQFLFAHDSGAIVAAEANDHGGAISSPIRRSKLQCSQGRKHVFFRPTKKPTKLLTWGAFQ